MLIKKTKRIKRKAIQIAIMTVIQALAALIAAKAVNLQVQVQMNLILNKIKAIMKKEIIAMTNLAEMTKMRVAKTMDQTTVVIKML